MLKGKRTRHRILQDPNTTTIMSYHLPSFNIIYIYTVLYLNPPFRAKLALGCQLCASTLAAKAGGYDDRWFFGKETSQKASPQTLLPVLLPKRQCLVTERFHRFGRSREVRLGRSIKLRLLGRAFASQKGRKYTFLEIH